MPNLIAYAALLAWPLAVVALFARLRLQEALVWSVLLGMFLLPANMGIDLPLLPAYDKTLAPSLAALVMCLVMARRKPAPAPPPGPGWLPRSPLAKGLSLAFLFLPVMVLVTNRSPVVWGPTVLPAHRLYDAGAILFSQGTVLLPFLLGRRYLSDDAGQRILVRALIAGAIVYTLPTLVELRLSPQFHNWVYGFYPSGFASAIRGGGYRPIVFFQHGLQLALFFSVAAVAAAALWRQNGRMIAAAFWLFVVVVLCNSLGAAILAIAVAPIAFLGGARLRVACAATLAAIVLIYPLLRGAGLIPTEAVLDFIATHISAERAPSLGVRFENEDGLIAHASQRPLFGWGLWDRHRLYDPETGEVLTQTDGIWAVVFAKHGWVGYLSFFGLLTLPVFRAALLLRRRALSDESVALALALGVNVTDLLVNQGHFPITWMIAGALLGRTEQTATAAAAVAPEHATTRRRPRPAIGAMPLDRASR